VNQVSPLRSAGDAPQAGRQRWPIAAAGVAVLGLVAALTLQIFTSPTASFLAVQRVTAGIPDGAWWFMTLLGDTSLLFALGSPLLRSHPQAVAACLAAIPVGGLLSVTLKAAFDAVRPAGVLDLSLIHIVGPVLQQHSFPSGHTITAFAAATALAASGWAGRGTIASRWANGALYVGASLVGVSRVAVGAHWPVDILAGACVGALAGYVGAYASVRYARFWNGNRGRLALAIGLQVPALWLLTHLKDYQPYSSLAWAAIACCGYTLVRTVERWRDNHQRNTKPPDSATPQ